MRKISILDSTKFLALIACIGVALSASAQTYEVLHNFSANHTDGAQPDGPLVQGFDGHFYGTTSSGGPGGARGYGTFFKVSTGGATTILHNFTKADSYPKFTLLLSQFGNFYGTTTISPTGDYGDFYKMTPSGDETILFQFCALPNCADGFGASSMIWDWDLNIRVTTTEAGGGLAPSGTILRLTPEGQETVIHTFCELYRCADGALPSAMILATDGNFYGTTAGLVNYPYNRGTIFVLGPKVPFTTLHTFCPSQPDCFGGFSPESLIQGSDGSLYGTTSLGGAHGDGTIFKISTAGDFSVLYNFCSLANCADGFGTSRPLVEGTDGNFYGINTYWGTGRAGTLYRITPAGSFTLLHTFDSSTDGGGPVALVQGTDGAFYGATAGGGTNGGGTIFRLDVGLGPFIRPVLTFGKVGATVVLLGTNLTGVTAVSFNGTPATFCAVAETRIRTTVPAGATSGPITVTTAAGTLTSNGAFTVVP
jgi:uncharacterized repeat protein (TIGR03803 family)